MFGLTPPVYLTIIYVSLIIIVIFVVGFLPGIIKSGKRVTFTSPVAFSSVYVDENYVGTAPVTTFLPPGEHNVVYSFKDVATISETIRVSHPLFLTWLIPRKQFVSSSFYLNEKNFPSYLEEILSDIIRYSAVLEFDEVTHYPPLLTRAATTFIEGNITNLTIMNSFLLDSSLFITSQVMLDDFTSAINILKENSIDTSNLSKEAGKIAVLFEDETTKTPLIQNRSSLVDSTPTSLTLKNMTIEGSSFSGGDIVVGKQIPLTYPGVEMMQIREKVESFSLSNREISEYQYAQFIEENSQWAKQNIDALVEEGVVDEAYLQGIYPTTNIISTTPIRNISYYAAVAFSEWIAKRSGKEVMLPSNSEIELAISLFDGGYQKSLFMPSNQRTPIALLGGVWELTLDEFIPLSRYLNRTIENKEIIEDIIVKGGSYLNDSSSVDKMSIGVMKKDQCSTTTGFRIVWK